jgi:hypothetical protein
VRLNIITKYFKEIGVMKNFTAALIIFFIPVFAVPLASCASSEEGMKKDSSEHFISEGDKTFTFQEKTDEGINEWKAVFKDDKLISLYKNGTRIKDNELKDYEDIVYENIPSGFPHHPKRFKTFKIYSDSLNGELEKMKSFVIKIPKLDNMELKANLDKMREELSALRGKKFEFHFDSDEFKESMKNLKKDLKKFKFDKKDFDFHFDSESFKKEMEELKIEIQKMKEEMKDLKINMDDLGEDMQKLEGFMEDVKQELVADGYIKYKDEKFNLSISANEMKVNNELIPEETFKKYKDLYENNYGKELDEEIKISVN